MTWWVKCAMHRVKPCAWILSATSHWGTPVTPAIGKQRQKDPMGLQASHSSQLMSPKKLGGRKAGHNTQCIPLFSIVAHMCVHMRETHYRAHFYLSPSERQNLCPGKLTR